MGWQCVWVALELDQGEEIESGSLCGPPLWLACYLEAPRAQPTHQPDIPQPQPTLPDLNPPPPPMLPPVCGTRV